EVRDGAIGGTKGGFEACELFRTQFRSWHRSDYSMTFPPISTHSEFEATLITKNQKSKSLFCPSAFLRLPVQSGKLAGCYEHHIGIAFVINAFEVIRRKRPDMDEPVHKRRTVRTDLLADFAQKSILAVAPACD